MQLPANMLWASGLVFLKVVRVLRILIMDFGLMLAPLGLSRMARSKIFGEASLMVSRFSVLR